MDILFSAPLNKYIREKHSTCFMLCCGALVSQVASLKGLLSWAAK